MLAQYVRVVVASVLLGLVASLPVKAQEVARTFDQLQVLLAPGQKIKIADSTGREYTATVERLSSSSLTVLSEGSRRELQAADIVRIRQRRPDRLWNGALIGAAGGFTYLALTVGQDFDGDVRAAISFYAGFSLLGSLIGTCVDARIKGWHVTYATPTSALPPAVTVVPLLAAGRKGMAVAWRF